MKTITILGSTGSIGTQTLDVVRANGDIQVAALAAGDNVALLEQQAREFRPRFVSCRTEENAAKLRIALKDMDVQVGSGMEGLLYAASVPQAQIAVGAVVGMMGIRPAMAAIQSGKDLALANKETLVTAGHLIIPMAREYGVRILPVDSEHSAIFQCLNGEPKDGIDQILLTASGGPFRGKTREQMKEIRVEDALKHPNWSMGKKVTIDSSTMVNKGLEVMEARWLFDVDYDQIQVVVQPKSLIHSMVQFRDGAIMAQFGTPDMRLMIQYALYYPERRYLAGERLDLARIGSIQFEAPDLVNFPGLQLAYDAGRRGGNMPTIFNAANERAVQLFLNRKIGYLQITDLIEDAMASVPYQPEPNLDQIFETEQMVYERIGRTL